MSSSAVFTSPAIGFSEATCFPAAHAPVFELSALKEAEYGRYAELTLNEVRLRLNRDGNDHRVDIGSSKKDFEGVFLRAVTVDLGRIQPELS